MWTVKDFKPIEELAQASDRAVAIIAGALADSKLSDLIRADFHLDDEPHTRAVRKEVFNHDGPLGSFGAKINLAYLSGYLTQDGHKDLTNLKNIRNLFAHYAEHNTFAGQKIKALCDNFRAVNTNVGGPAAWAEAEDGTRRTFDSITIVGNKLLLNAADPDFLTGTPKGRFLGTAKLFVASVYAHMESGMTLNKPIF
jgi:DNA-binding MltR family transcriptional regulator